MKKIADVFSSKVFKIIFGLLRFVVYGVLIIYVSFTLFQRFTNNSSFYGYRLFNVATGSMIPVYNISDVIIVKETDYDLLKVGDDVAYKGERGGFEGKIITHRIIKIEENSKNGDLIFFTKGVNATAEDPSIRADQILGRVEGKLFFVNEINHIVHNNYGFFFLVFFPLVLVISLEIAQSIVEVKLEKNLIKEVGFKNSNKNKCEEEKEDKEEEIELLD